MLCLFEAPDRRQLSGAFGAIADDSTAFNLVEHSVLLTIGVVMRLRFIRPIPIERLAKDGFCQIPGGVVRTAYDIQFAKSPLYLRVQFLKLFSRQP